MQSPPSLRRVRPGFDWTSLRLFGESELEAALDAAPYRQAESEADELRGGILANAEVSPALYRAKEIVREVLGLQRAIHLYIVASDGWRTGLLADGPDGSIQLAITSGVAARLQAREATFVLGRLVGRRLLGCRELPARVNPLYDSSALLVRGVQRFQDLAADRVGLLCCQDVHVAAKAVVRLTSGLPDELLQIDLPGLLRQRPDEAETLAHGDEHAFCLLRLAAAAIFFSSPNYVEAFDRSAATIFPSQLEPPPAVTTPLVGEATQAPTPPFLPPAAEEPSAESAPAVAVVAFKPQAPPAACETTPPPPTIAASTRAPQKPLVKVLRPVEGAAGLLEEVYLPVETPDAAPTPLSTCEEKISSATAARRFTWWAGRRLGSLSDGEDAARRGVLEKFGFEEYKTARWPADVDECDAQCRRAADVLKEEAVDLRTGVMRDVLSIAAVGGRMTEPADAAVGWLGDCLGISPDEMTSLRSEYVDPEFADYAFSRGQAVQVRWDGSWVAGVVRDLEPDGDLRVHFAEENILLRLSPRADLIRPAAAKRAV